MKHYRVLYSYRWVDDEKVSWKEATFSLGTFPTDRAAQLASIPLNYRDRYVTRIWKERKAGPNWVTDREVEVPRSSHCACGKEYWPIREEPCHSWHLDLAWHDTAPGDDAERVKKVWESWIERKP